MAEFRKAQHLLQQPVLWEVGSFRGVLALKPPLQGLLPGARAQARLSSSLDLMIHPLLGPFHFSFGAKNTGTQASSWARPHHGLHNALSLSAADAGLGMGGGPESLLNQAC